MYFNSILFLNAYYHFRYINLLIFISSFMFYHHNQTIAPNYYQWTYDSITHFHKIHWFCIKSVSFYFQSVSLFQLTFSSFCCPQWTISVDMFCAWIQIFWSKFCFCLRCHFHLRYRRKWTWTGGKWALVVWAQVSCQCPKVVSSFWVPFYQRI